VAARLSKLVYGVFHISLVYPIACEVDVGPEAKMLLSVVSQMQHSRCCAAQG
jgi:hypothetical protein